MDNQTTQPTKLYWPIEQLKNWADNPREISVEKFADLKASLEQEGQLIPLLVDIRPDHSGEVLGGNMTLRVLRELGVQQVWVELREPRNDAHAFELAIKHNMGYGNYNAQQVAELGQRYIDQINLSKIDLTLQKAISVGDTILQFGPGGVDPVDYADRNKEVDVDALASGLSAICPRCGFHFSPNQP